MKSKTIILSSNNEKGRGILTLFQDEDLLQCRLRLYNTPTLTRHCKIGIYHNNEVFSANLLEKNGAYESSMVGDFNIDQDFYTAIIDTANQNNVILSGGTYAGFFFNDNSVFENDFSKNTNSPLENNNSMLEDNITIKTENDELKNFDCDKNDHDCDKCLNCKYKEFFYSQKVEIKNEEKVEEINDNQKLIENEKIEEKNSNVKALVNQFKYVFENYSADETLNTLIPNGKFVKINENENQYSIGAIYEDEKMKYICYAVMCSYNTPAPEELGEHYQWLPLDKLDPLSEGYYVVFQDANDLKIVEM